MKYKFLDKKAFHDGVSFFITKNILKIILDIADMLYIVIYTYLWYL